MRITITFCIIFLSLSSGGCSKSDRAIGKPRRRPNVLLIAVDTMRADKLGCYGDTLGLTPHIDRLARSGVRFENAYAHSSWTLPSFASLFTSLYPPQHGAFQEDFAFRKLPESVETVAERFRKAGYVTGAVTNVDYLSPPFGLTRGFASLNAETAGDKRRGRKADVTTVLAANWIYARKDTTFFLLVHYYDPHLYYLPPQPYRMKYAAAEDKADTSWIFGTTGDMQNWRRKRRKGNFTPDPGMIDRAERLYNGEIAFTDHEVGRLLHALGKLHLADSTIVVFTADHGEEFLDHGSIEHGHTLYEELIRVPLIIRYPGSLEPATVSTVVRHVDVAPTLCELAGLAVPPSFVGKSLTSLVKRDGGRDRTVFAWGSFWSPPIAALRKGDHKLIVSPDGRMELFRIPEDPGEKHDISSREPELLRGIASDLDRMQEKMTRRKGDIVDMDQVVYERLKELGYILPEEDGGRVSEKTRDPSAIGQ